MIGLEVMLRAAICAVHAGEVNHYARGALRLVQAGDLDGAARAVALWRASMEDVEAAVLDLLETPGSAWFTGSLAHWDGCNRNAGRFDA